MTTSYKEARPPDNGPIALRLVPKLPRSEGDPFTRTELANARRLMRALQRILDEGGCPVAASILDAPD